MGYREEHRADQAAEREQERADKALLMDKQLEAHRIAAEEKRRDKAAAEERRQKAAEAAAERARRDAADQARAKKAAKAARSAGRRRAVAWVRNNGDVAAVLAVMVCGMVPALDSQFASLHQLGMGMLLAGLLPFLLELGAWASTAGEAKALREQRNVRPYRIAVWTQTLLAASVNAMHGGRDYGVIGAVVLAASSVVPVALWHMVMAGRHSAKAKRTKVEIAAEKKRREEAKARAEHLKKRRKDHPEVAKEADRMLSALPFGTADPEQVFAAAWEILKGSELGMTPDLYKRATASRLAVGEAFRTEDERAPELLRASMLASLHRPFPGRLASGLRTLGPVSPLRSLPRGSGGATAQAGIGLLPVSGAPEIGPQKGAEGGAGDGRRGRSETELEALLPDAREAARELVAEGKQISAAGLAKALKVRREDGMWLRDRVIAERRNGGLRIVEDGDADGAVGASA